ncbi:hypothetical protein [Halobacillus sp. Marseille-P3879]|uniref:hypothetical protein n=1 Tax=Halobacillus sp. Marseille-P3879 TaxID=2045014 RepID=UPI0011AF0AED|nr:hypothetical protein [Halobacillus sp. Marseille-P3879]
MEKELIGHEIFCEAERTKCFICLYIIYRGRADIKHWSIKSFNRVDMDATAIGGLVTFIFGCIAFTILFHRLIRRLMENRKASFWSVLLWVPYFLLFVFTFVSLFPITNPSDEPAAATGLIIIFMVCFYPFYLLVLQVFGTGVGITED